MGRYRFLSVESDAKTVKGQSQGYLTGILYLAPANECGIANLCTSSTEECRAACLYTAGMASVFPSIVRNRIEKTLRYLRDPKQFTADLCIDIDRLCDNARSRRMTPCVRINGTSDLPKLAMGLARRYPTVQFYDYTKHTRPWLRTRPNYHLTYSHSGLASMPDVKAAIRHGVNVAVLFSGKVLPQQWHGWQVVDGDLSDLRFLDPIGVVVGLRAKGRAKQISPGGFVQIGATVATVATVMA
jgi:hypothetical protein